MSILFRKRRSWILLPLVGFLFACLIPGQPAGSNSTATAAATPSLSFTPTPPTPRKLTICLGQEPNTLYPFSGPNDAAQSVLQAIDDGPIDTVGYTYQPVILQKLPSLADGDAQISPVTVSAGTKVVDANGDLTALAVGTPVRPASCRASNCVVKYDGVSTLRMDQLVVTFRLRSDVTWSDGSPLTADDSVYAYQLAANQSTPGSKFLVERTQTYEAADPTTVQWWGIPGFIDPAFMTDFWAPVPKHAWSQFGAADLPNIDIAARSPMGWGPYKIQEWVAGDHITLEKNPYYFRAAQGYPKFDQLVFRFISDPNQAISELIGGGCDLLDPSINLDSQVALLKQMQQADQIQAYFTQGLSMEWLGLGITPASYDNGYSTLDGDRPAILSDARTRQAIALCLDRQKVVDSVLFGESAVPDNFVASGHPLFENGLPAYHFDPSTGEQLLDQVGWRDLDGNPATPRQAVGVKNVPAGTKLVLNYFTTPNTQRRQATDILTSSLGQCGIGVKVQFYSQNDFYAPGPDGWLFGRRFDLAEYALSTDSIEPPCQWFSSAEIPDASNNWVGTNVSGYKNPDYDAACQTAQTSLPGEKSYIDSYHQTQAIFATDLPSIPLYYRVKVAASRPDLCHFALDPSAQPLWNIEAFDVGSGCQP